MFSYNDDYPCVLPPQFEEILAYHCVGLTKTPLDLPKEMTTAKLEEVYAIANKNILNKNLYQCLKATMKFPTLAWRFSDARQFIAGWHDKNSLINQLPLEIVTEIIKIEFNLPLSFKLFKATLSPEAQQLLKQNDYLELKQQEINEFLDKKKQEVDIAVNKVSSFFNSLFK